MQNEPITLQTDQRTTLVLSACVAAAAALAGHDLAEVEHCRELLAKSNLTNDLLLSISDTLSALAEHGNITVHMYARFASPIDPNDKIC